MKEAILLWLYYDYTTELFNRSLPHRIDSNRGIAVVRSDYIYHSSQRAGMVYGFIMETAMSQGVSADEMNEFRETIPRKSMKSVIVEYEYIRENYGDLYNFVDDRMEYSEMINRDVLEQNRKSFDFGNP